MSIPTHSHEKWLVFVDTNIMLDFYRLPGESAERQLKGLKRHLNALIVTEQIQMEFLKHRQRVIVDGIGKIEKPTKVQLPMIVSGSRAAKTLTSRTKTALKTHGDIRKKVESILKEPGKHDPVYKALRQVFANNNALNLRRPNKLRFDIRTRARKRFLLGYPPRKAGDTSIGDAFNWEWIIHCAQQSRENHNVLIVSRDGDYGVTYADATILNDWLRAEFKARVGKRRKIELTNKLTSALKKLDETVPAEDEKAEESIIREPLGNWLNVAVDQNMKVRDDFTRTILEILRKQELGEEGEDR